MYALIVELDVRPEHMEALRSALDALVDMARREPGTLLYAVHRCATDPNIVRLYELYADESAFRDHAAQPLTRSFLESLEEWLATPPRLMASPLLSLSHQFARVRPLVCADVNPATIEP